MRQRTHLQPQRAGTGGGVDTGLIPPTCFITAVMDFAVMSLTIEPWGNLIVQLGLATEAAPCDPTEPETARESVFLPIRRPANHGRPLQKPTTHESQKN
jgi:hypothetical protein